MKPNRILPMTLATLMALQPISSLAKHKNIKSNHVITMNDVKSIKGEDILVVAKTLYAEARGEGEDGLRHVASVIWNRADGDRSKFAKICKAPYQFSCWNGKSDIVVDYNSYSYKVCLKIAKQMFLGIFKPTQFKPKVGNAENYCTTKLFFSDASNVPSWIKAARKRGVYDVRGNHVFFNS